MSPLAALTPAWIAFEVLQLVMSERYLGVKHIQAGKDPRLNGPSESVSALWTCLIILYWLWLLAMLFARADLPRLVALISVTVIGYTVRRNCGLKWVLVVLTFEGAVRIGMLVSLTTLLWRQAV